MKLLELRYSREYQVYCCVACALGTVLFLTGSLFVLFYGGLVFGAILLGLSCLFGWVTIDGAYAAFDRSIKLSVDQIGIHDYSAGQDIPWGPVLKVDLGRFSKGGYYLLVTMKDRSQATAYVDGLDMEPEAIAQETKAIWEEALAHTHRVQSFEG